jgi:hypothetical protein
VRNANRTFQRKIMKNAKRLNVVFALLLSSAVLAGLMLVLSLPPSSAVAGPPLPTDAGVGDAPPTGARGPWLGADAGAGFAPSLSQRPTNDAPLAITLPDACVAPIVQSGSIITGVNPVIKGRLVRNGVAAVCGEDFTCSGVQSTGSDFSYEPFNFINPSPAWQCVHIDLDASSCGQQVYSAAYLNSFDPADLCANNQGAMGFSTSGRYGYSFIVPPRTDFTIVNNTTGISPSSDCASYTMTATLCSAELGLDVTKRPISTSIHADSAGRAVVPVELLFHNTGTYTQAVDATLVSETVSIDVLDGIPAVADAVFGRAGAIIPPGATVTRTVPLLFSGSQFQCLPRTYRVSSTLEMPLGVYDCNGYNPPSAILQTGSLLPNTNMGEDIFAFQSAAGDQITVTVDTVAAATAFNIEACVSGTAQGACLPGFQGDDTFNCTFAPPAGQCPRFGGFLPADPDGDNIYYVRINSASGALDFAGPVGEYRAAVLVTSGPSGACRAVPVLDDGTRTFSSLARSSAAPYSTESQMLTTTVVADVLPIDIMMPPSNPSSPSCGGAYLPVVLR